MRIKIKRVDKELPLPVYESGGAVAFDLITRTDEVIEPGTVARLPVNIIVETPPGYMLMLAPRSSMPAKKFGLIKPHSVGIVDQDYRGPNDEIMFQVQNIGDKPVTVSRGEKIGQAVFVKIEKAEWEEVEEVIAESRGGFGSTG